MAKEGGKLGTPTFLYGRKGPWPQPNPYRPLSKAPVVINVPWQEQVDWALRIGLRFAVQIVGGVPAALWDSFRYRPTKHVEDSRFDEIMTSSAYEKFLTSGLTASDSAAFASQLKEPGATFYKSDFSAVSTIRPYKRTYMAPTVSLIREKDGNREVAAIRLGDIVLDRTMGDAWETAKYFVLQGAAYSMLFTEHPNLHFPYDSINAITKTSLPQEHLIFKLLKPHLRFQLELNQAVLLSRGSVITSFRPTLYAPFTANMDDGLLDLFAAGYRGVDGNPAYPTYAFRKAPKPVNGDYGVFLNRYYATVLEFTRQVAAKIPKGDEYTERWANYISRWVPGFPSPTEIFEGDTLAEVLAGIVWNLSIGHSVDHHAFSFDVTPEEKYLRIRVPPPTSTTAPATDAKKVTRWYDRFKTRLAHKVFFEPTTVTRLVDVRYRFGAEHPDLMLAADQFIEALHRTEANMDVRTFMPLRDMSASIQF